MIKTKNRRRKFVQRDAKLTVHDIKCWKYFVANKTAKLLTMAYCEERCASAELQTEEKNQNYANKVIIVEIYLSEDDLQNLKDKILKRICNKIK